VLDVFRRAIAPDMPTAWNNAALKLASLTFTPDQAVSVLEGLKTEFNLSAKEYFLLTKVYDLVHGNISAAEGLITLVIDESDQEAADMLKTIRLTEGDVYTFFIEGQTFFNNFEEGAYTSERALHLPGGLVIINGEHTALVAAGHITSGTVTEDGSGNTVVNNLVIDGQGPFDNIYAGLDVVTVGTDRFVVYVTRAGAITLLKAEEYGDALLHETAHSSYLTDITEDAAGDVLYDEYGDPYTEESYFIDNLEANIIYEGDVWAEVLANTYETHSSSITTPDITYTLTDVDADTKTITITPASVIHSLSFSWLGITEANQYV